MLPLPDLEGCPLLRLPYYNIGSYVLEGYQALCKADEKPWPSSRQHFNMPKTLPIISVCSQGRTRGAQLIVQVPFSSDILSFCDSIMGEITTHLPPSPVHKRPPHPPQGYAGQNNTDTLSSPKPVCRNHLRPNRHCVCGSFLMKLIFVYAR